MVSSQWLLVSGASEDPEVYEVSDYSDYSEFSEVSEVSEYKDSARRAKSQVYLSISQRGAAYPIKKTNDYPLIPCTRDNKSLPSHHQYSSFNINNMKKHLLFLFAALLPLVTNAHDFEVNGIYYNITSETDKTVEVTFKGNDYDSFYNEYYSGFITLPATVTHNGVAYSVTSIGEYAFYECSSLTAITIPEGVTSIGEYAFYGCTSLTAINIPEGVTSIEGQTFYECSSLTAITIPESVTSIGDDAFFDCSNLTAITIPESVTRIGNLAFF